MGIAWLRDVTCEKIDDEVFIGSVGNFNPLDWPEPEIAYSLDRPFWGQGFATEAARTARDWLFEHFPLNRAASFVHPDNLASKRVVERLGVVFCRFSKSPERVVMACW